MKISLFIKSYTTKTFCLFILISFIAGAPIQANAGFFDFITGPSTQAADAATDEFGTDDFANNSQNIPLLETSIDPDMKSAGGNSSVNIAEDGVLLSDTGLIGSGLESISSGEMTVYEVKEGDTLSEIAAQYDISVNTIRWENNITGQNIKIGQKLNILPVTGVKHTVKSGDTLDKIANKYDADVDDIMIFNAVSKSDVLKIGDILYVPNGIITAVTIQKPVATSPNKTVSSSSGNKAEIGYYIRPTTGRITSPYGSRKGGFHYGIDVGTPRGTTVVASASGVITEVVSYCVERKTSCGGRYGNYITIQHSNGTTTRYAHLSKVSVFEGQQVSQGEKIGATGNTGHTTGPHLHFQIEKSNGSTVRPPAF